jgi:hypothetical protein
MPSRTLCATHFFFFFFNQHCLQISFFAFDELEIACETFTNALSKKRPRTSTCPKLEFGGAKYTPINHKTLLPEMVFFSCFSGCIRNVIYELSSLKLSVAAFFFLHLWVQICLLRKFLAFCFSNSHLKSPNLHLTMQFSHFKVLICVQIDILQILLKSRNTNFESKICTFMTHLASHKCGMKEAIFAK